MNRTSTVQVQEATFDPRVNHKIRTFLRELNKASTSFWELPQPKPQDRVTGLQKKELVHMFGVSTRKTTIQSDRNTVDSRNMARPPPGARANPLARWR